MQQLLLSLPQAVAVGQHHHLPLLLCRPATGSLQHSPHLLTVILDGPQSDHLCDDALSELLFDVLPLCLLAVILLGFEFFDVVLEGLLAEEFDIDGREVAGLLPFRGFRLGGGGRVEFWVVSFARELGGLSDYPFYCAHDTGIITNHYNFIDSHCKPR